MASKAEVTKKTTTKSKKNSKEKPTYYITTPIYYSSGNLHIGHCYTTVCCDAIARFKRMEGYDVFYLTGTDEHGQKVEEVAKAAGVAPKTYVDGVVEQIKKLWQRLGITYDKFIRTTDDYHERAIQKIFTHLYEKGDIYKSKYKGKYCKPCESFWTESQLVDGKCPDCGREVQDAEEESYFFKLSKYADRVRELLTNGEYLQPQSRVNEMVNNFLDKGLTDLSVSRTLVEWGVKVPFDPKHTVYVWIDALFNYVTALGYGSDDTSLYEKFWPCDLHVMAKEIVRFHSIIWPAFLMAMDMPLPKKMYGHGWILFDGEKMSKSKGNVVDPFILTDRYGVDSLRYYLLREIPFGEDSDYSGEKLLTRINYDIVNDLGNLVRRTLAMADQYFGGNIHRIKPDKADDDFINAINGAYPAMKNQLDKPEVNRAIECVFDLVDKANKYIDFTKPWVLNKENQKARLECVMYNLLESLRVISTLLMPFLIDFPYRIFEGLNIAVPTDFSGAKYAEIEQYKTKIIEPIMHRLDIEKELKELDEIATEIENKKAGKKSEAKEPAKKQETAKQENTSDNLITIDQFFQTKLIAVTIKQCEKVENADKLLKLTVDDGEKLRTVVSGIAMSYQPNDLIGKQAVLVANLKPAKLRGIVSEGMLLCATKEGKPVLITPSEAVESGSEIC